MILKSWVVGILALAGAVGHGVAVAQDGQVIRIGGMCDRTGATRVIGDELCPGVADYIALVNKNGGVLGHKLAYTEIDHAYMVPRAVDAYERLKKEGVVAVFTYGVPTLLGLTSRFMEDKIPSLNPGTGRADAIDGEVWPYIFPGTASYWSQAGVAMQYLKEKGTSRSESSTRRGSPPPLTMTPQDHEGGGYLRMYQVKGNEWVPVSD